MTPQPHIKSVILDATVVINLIKMGELGILPKLKSYEFWVPNHVKDEVHRKTQRLRLRKALKAGWLKELEITDLAEVELYVQNRSRFGEGESAGMAIAQARGWIEASDDRAVKREVKAKMGPDRLLDTRKLLQEAVNKGTLEQPRFESLCNRFDL